MADYRPRKAYNRETGRYDLALTYTPCQGCGSVRGRVKDELCQDCLGLMDAGRTFRLLQADERSRAKGIYTYNCVWHWNPPYPDGGSQNGRPVGEAFIDLVFSVAEPKVENWKTAPDRHRLINRQGGDGMGRDLLIDHQTAGALMALDAAIVAYGNGAYNDGVRYGRSMLRQLAAGDLTVSELNTQGIRAAKEPR